MPADRIYDDAERGGYFFARQAFIDEAQDLFFSDGQYFGVILFIQFHHLAIGGIDYQASGRNIEQ